LTFPAADTAGVKIVVLAAMTAGVTVSLVATAGVETLVVALIAVAVIATETETTGVGIDVLLGTVLGVGDAPPTRTPLSATCNTVHRADKIVALTLTVDVSPVI
jgi:hypothetical protein